MLDEFWNTEEKADLRDRVVNHHRGTFVVMCVG